MMTRCEEPSPTERLAMHAFFSPNLFGLTANDDVLYFVLCMGFAAIDRLHYLVLSQATAECPTIINSVHPVPRGCLCQYQ